MVDRVQLNVPVYMKLDGLWQIVLTGTVIDVPAAGSFSGPHVTVLSPSETAGALGSHGGPTTVRNKRTAA